MRHSPTSHVNVECTMSTPAQAPVIKDDLSTISLNLRDMSQLFNSMDPSPFREKELDDDADEFIVAWARELPPDAPLRLRVYLERWPTEDPKDVVVTAIHNHFSHRATITSMELSQLLKQGRTSLLIGLMFLAVCLFLSNSLAAHAQVEWGAVVTQSLTIGGWVAMWRPMQIYLYDWWPLWQRKRVFSKLSHIPVEVLHRQDRYPA